MIGGKGKDKLFGEEGADVFVFESKKDSRKGNKADKIADFEGDDVIDLSAIDASNRHADNSTFRFIGKRDFHEKRGELHYVKKNNYLIVEGDINGDGKPDFQIKVYGVNSLDSGHFAL